MLHSFDLERTGSPKQSPEQLQALGHPPHAGLRQRSPSPDLHSDVWVSRPLQQHTGLACVTDTASLSSSEEMQQRETARRAYPVVAEHSRIQTAYGGELLVEARVRGLWLLGLLALQSLSSFILDANEALLREHFTISLFLTMLVGAGGNSGAQSAVHVIRGLATGQFPATRDALRTALHQQLRVGFLLGTALALGGYARVMLTEGLPLDATAIAASLFCIVNVSVAAGTTLPFALAWGGVDPAHAGTTVQVTMDVLGVAITVLVCRLVLTGNAAAVLGGAGSGLVP